LLPVFSGRGDCLERYAYRIGAFDKSSGPFGLKGTLIALALLIKVAVLSVFSSRMTEPQLKG